jgi:hypothetical protein
MAYWPPGLRPSWSLEAVCNVDRYPSSVCSQHDRDVKFGQLEFSLDPAACDMSYLSASWRTAPRAGSPNPYYHYCDIASAVRYSDLYPGAIVSPNHVVRRRKSSLFNVAANDRLSSHRDEARVHHALHK